MSYTPTRLDVISDLRRCIYASFAKKGFNDMNAKTFLENAEENLKEIDLDKATYCLAVEMLNKAKNSRQSLEKRREDLLMASTILSV